MSEQPTETEQRPRQRTQGGKERTTTLAVAYPRDRLDLSGRIDGVPVITRSGTSVPSDRVDEVKRVAHELSADVTEVT